MNPSVHGERSYMAGGGGLGDDKEDKMFELRPIYNSRGRLDF